MKRSTFVLGVLAVALIAVPAVQAEVQEASGSADRFIAPGGGNRPSLVQPLRAFPAKQELDPVLRPPAIDPTMPPPAERSAASKAGPIASFSGFSAGSLNRGGGMALTPRGGAMSTPRQQADRAIHRVIRRLD